MRSVAATAPAPAQGSSSSHLADITEVKQFLSSRRRNPRTTIDPQTSLADLILNRPALAEPLEALGLDYCCNGRRSLAAAGRERGLDVDTLVRVLEALDRCPGSAVAHAFDARAASTADLCEHLVTAHHDPLRHELPLLAETLKKVVRAHGADDPRLTALANAFDRLAAELLPHFEREEQLLFPAFQALESDDAPPNAQALLTELEDDHGDVGRTLLQLRQLADGYRLETARCRTHQALLGGLAALERDLHQHIHEENNVLFPRVRSRLAA